MLTDAKVPARFGHVVTASLDDLVNRLEAAPQHRSKMVGTEWSDRRECDSPLHAKSSTAPDAPYMVVNNAPSMSDSSLIVQIE